MCSSLSVVDMTTGKELKTPGTAVFVANAARGASGTVRSATNVVAHHPFTVMAVEESPLHCIRIFWKMMNFDGIL